MIVLLFVIFAFTIILALTEDYLQQYKPYIYISLCVVLILVAGLRPVGCDLDSEFYEYYFNHYDDRLLEFSVEPSYRILSEYLHFFTDDVNSIFLIYATLALCIKFTTFRQYSKELYFLPVVVYLSNYFMLHEMTQIRAGVSCSLFLMGIPYLSNKQYAKYIMIIAVATLFHYSAIFFLVFLAFRNSDLSIRWRIALWLVIPIGYIIDILNINLIASLPIPYIQNKVEVYQELSERGIMGDGHINVFNILYLYRMAVFTFMLIFYDAMHAVNRYLPIMLCIKALGILLMLVLAWIPIFAYRLSEMCEIVDIIILCNLYNAFKPSIVGKCVVIAICTVQFLLNIYYAELINTSY